MHKPVQDTMWCCWRINFIENILKKEQTMKSNKIQGAFSKTCDSWPHYVTSRETEVRKGTVTKHNRKTYEGWGIISHVYKQSSIKAWVSGAAVQRFLAEEMCLATCV